MGVPALSNDMAAAAFCRLTPGIARELVSRAVQRCDNVQLGSDMANSTRQTIHTVFLRCSLAICPATHNHTPVSATLRPANSGVPTPVIWPSPTNPAESTSPALVKNVSMAALALYLASRDVGRNSAWRSVFWME